MTRRSVFIIFLTLFALIAVWWLATKYSPKQISQHLVDRLDIDSMKQTDTLIEVKLQEVKTFRDFPVTETFIGQIPKNFNFSTCKYGKRYKTISIEAANDGAVFAGHYAFARIGCATSCQISTIIDLKTGNVYAGPDAQSGYEYKINSKIILVNPPICNDPYFPCDDSKTERYLWTDNKLKRLE